MSFCNLLFDPVLGNHSLHLCVLGQSVSGQSRRGSQINVNVTPSQTTDPSSDTPEIRKYKKRFNSDILCASLWGEFYGVVSV